MVSWVGCRELCVGRCEETVSGWVGAGRGGWAGGWVGLLQAYKSMHTRNASSTTVVLDGYMCNPSSIRPRLGSELQSRIAAWGLQALAGAATVATARGMSSWAEAEEAATALSNVVAFSLLAQHQGEGEKEVAALGQQG